MTTYTYESSVNWLRNQPEYTELVKLCYLDKDNIAAAKRFASSEEFQEIKNLLKLNRSTQNLKVLDLGCGNGIASYAFATLGHSVVSVDPDLSSDVGLNATKRLATYIQIGSIETVQAFAESLPFAEATFDIIYTRQALHHFTDLQQGLSECARVLKSDGLMLATREHVVSDENQLNEFLENHLLHRLHGGENAYKVEEYIRALKQAGFRRIRSFGPFDNVINHFPDSNATIENRLYKSLLRFSNKTCASFLSQFDFIEFLYRKYASYKYSFPGRLYSFLSFK